MLEEHVGAFLAHLRAQRYCAQTVQRTERVVRLFLTHLAGRVDQASDLRPHHALAFFEESTRGYRRRHRRAMPCLYREKLQSGLNRFLRYLAGLGLAPAALPPRRRDPCSLPGYEQLLAEYAGYLRNHRGLVAGTIENYLSHARGLCRARGCSRASWEYLKPTVVYGYLLRHARGRAHRTVLAAYTALRSFFRFLRLTGRVHRPLERFFVRYRVYLPSPLPRALGDEELKHVFAAVRGDAACAVRHRALLLLLALHGLRVGEAARLCLDDIAWRSQAFTLRRRKAGRDLTLPLHPAVARALAVYIERVRPRGTPYREVFLTSVAPRPFRCGSDLERGVVHYLAARGVRLRLHALRHTLATRLINHDCPPEWIQLLLGHVHPASTQIYARVDLAHLREVADAKQGVR